MVAIVTLPFGWLEAIVTFLLTWPVRPLWRWLDARSHGFEGTIARRVIAMGLFPLLMILAVVLGFEIVERGIKLDTLMWTMGYTFALGALMAPLERLMPWSRKWLDHGDSGTDILMLFGNAPLYGVLSSASLFLTAWLVEWIHLNLPPDTIRSFWPHFLHPVVQVFLLILAMDFFRYWYHRWMHENAFMWRWHSVHHSSSRLYWFNGMRTHPLENFVSNVIWVVPFTLIQAPAEIVFVAGLVSRTIGRFQHTNIDVNLGPFEYIFSAPNNHRYHHSKAISEGNSNYGGDVIVWDILFGSFHLPKGGRPGEDIGVGGVEDYPKSWLGLVLAPFNQRLWRDAGPRSNI